MAQNGESDGDVSHVFPSTCWSLVLAARESSPESAVALETLCRDYWYPLYAYVRRSGYAVHDAQDLTQEFFCRLLEKRWLDDASQTRGRLRSFLIVALKNFMSKEWRRASAQRRGGGLAPVPLDTALAESRLAADGKIATPEEAYDQQWALQLLELTMARLREEFVAANKPEAFEVLKHCLLADRGALDYEVVAKAVAMREGAARVAVHRLRKRFREIYRAEIARTLTPDADVEDELRHLAAALTRC